MRHKGAVFMAGVAGGVLALILSLPQTPIYQSQVSLEIQGLNEGFLGMQDVNPTQEGAGRLGPDLATQVEVIQSRTLVTTVADKVQEGYQESELEASGGRLGVWMQALGMQSEPAEPARWSPAIAMAADTVKAIPSRDSRIVRISTESPDPSWPRSLRTAWRRRLLHRASMPAGKRRSTPRIGWNGNCRTSG